MAACRFNTRGLFTLSRSLLKRNRTYGNWIYCLHSQRSKGISVALPLTQRCLMSHHSFPYPNIHTDEAAKTFVIQLDERSRSYLLNELQRVKKGRELKFHPLPKVSGQAVDVEVTAKQLYQVFMFNGVPFIGFGILDNLIMIVAGEYIDATIGATLGISTMAAAGLGNLISDIAGVGTAGYVEKIASRIGVETPDLTSEQADSNKVRWMIGWGRTVGISIGCLIGMFPLLFFNDEEKKAEQEEKRKKAAEKAKKKEATPVEPVKPNQTAS